MSYDRFWNDDDKSEVTKRPTGKRVVEGLDEDARSGVARDVVLGAISVSCLGLALWIAVGTGGPAVEVVHRAPEAPTPAFALSVNNDTAASLRRRSPSSRVRFAGGTSAGRSSSKVAVSAHRRPGNLHMDIREAFIEGPASLLVNFDRGSDRTTFLDWRNRARSTSGDYRYVLRAIESGDGVKVFEVSILEPPVVLGQLVVEKRDAGWTIVRTVPNEGDPYTSIR